MKNIEAIPPPNQTAQIGDAESCDLSPISALPPTLNDNSNTYSELNLNLLSSSKKTQLDRIIMKDKGKRKTVFNLNCLDPSHLQVNRDIVSGLKYVQHTYRTGVKGKGPTHYTVPNSAPH